jgi:hypothetical protein
MPANAGVSPREAGYIPLNCVVINNIHDEKVVEQLCAFLFLPGIKRIAANVHAFQNLRYILTNPLCVNCRPTSKLTIYIRSDPFSLFRILENDATCGAAPHLGLVVTWTSLNRRSASRLQTPDKQRSGPRSGLGGVRVVNFYT